MKTVLTNEVAAVNFLSKQESLSRLATLVMAEHGLHEPYLRTSLISLVTKKVDALEKKMKIPIKKARYLIGVIDESGTLCENEVFVNIKQSPLNRRVIVTRNPCRHPGGNHSNGKKLTKDVRVLEAVDRLELSHLRDCIVFPRVGQRPLMDMMSGGDLDGDMYFVCWDETLIPILENVIPPSEYPKSKPPPSMISAGFQHIPLFYSYFRAN
jgi:RNA-dependent RNA polymerase